MCSWVPGTGVQAPGLGPPGTGAPGCEAPGLWGSGLRAPSSRGPGSEGPGSGLWGSGGLTWSELRLGRGLGAEQAGEQQQAEQGRGRHDWVYLLGPDRSRIQAGSKYRENCSAQRCQHRLRRPRPPARQQQPMRSGAGLTDRSTEQ